MATSRAAAPAADLETRLAPVPDDGRVPPVRDPRPGAVLRGARPRDDASRHRPGGRRGRVRRSRCARTTGRSPPTAATTTRWPAARSMGAGCTRSCSAARTACMGGKGGSMHITSVEHHMMGSYAIVGAHLPIALGRRLVRPVPQARSRSRSASSATGRPTSARSTRRSTWPPCGRRRSCSCARTTATWSTRAIDSVTAVARPAADRAVRLRPGADRGRRQRRGRRVRGRQDGAGPGAGRRGAVADRGR